VGTLHTKKHRTLLKHIDSPIPWLACSMLSFHIEAADKHLVHLAWNSRMLGISRLLEIQLRGKVDPEFKRIGVEHLDIFKAL
jgi:hypothetical protein